MFHIATLLCFLVVCFAAVFFWFNKNVKCESESINIHLMASISSWHSHNWNTKQGTFFQAQSEPCSLYECHAIFNKMLRANTLESTGLLSAILHLEGHRSGTMNTGGTLICTPGILSVRLMKHVIIRRSWIKKNNLSRNGSSISHKSSIAKVV